MAILESELLTAVKANLQIDFDNDDELILRLIRSAVDYAERYQNRDYSESDCELPHSTTQGIVMLATHWYESRDGSTAGYFSSSDGERAVRAAERLLSANKRWLV